MHAATARWVPSHVRSSWVSQTYFGSTFGMVFTSPMVGIIISYLGWEACFYIIASLTLLWSLAWYLVVYDSPNVHPRISPEELEEVASLQVVETSKPAVPWLEIIKSPTIWGTLITDMCNTFGIIILSGYGSVYFKYMLGLDIKANGILSGLPMFSRYAGGVAFARLSDWLIRTERMTRLNARRIFNSLSQVGPAILIIILGYSGCDVSVAVIIKVSRERNGESFFSSQFQSFRSLLCSSTVSLPVTL